MTRAERTVLDRGAIRLDRARRRCTVGGARVELTAKEFGLLQLLMEQPGRVFSRGQLLDRLWGPGIHVTPRTIDTHVKRIREKLGSAGGLISTVRGVGYRLDRRAVRRL
jgi:two-component system phosphate regulon response regulator PhoB